MEMNSGRVLVLLDSADEGGEAWAKSKALEMLFERRGLEDCTYVATSRPCSLAYDLVPFCRQRFYLTGFNDRRLDELLVRRLGKEDGLGFAEKLREPTLQHVRQLMKGTPLVANMVAELAADDTATTLPSSGTQIYKAMAANVVRRQAHKLSGRPERSGGRDIFACLPDDVKARLEKLGHVALNGLCKRQFVFDVEEVVAKCGREVMDYGFLEEFEHESVSQGPCHDVEFRHLTWLEFFAAYALSCKKSPLGAVELCMDTVGVEEETEPFWKFVCGLVDPKYLKDILACLRTAFLIHDRTKLRMRQGVRLASSCIAEVAQQVASDSSLEENRIYLVQASAAVIPSKVDVSNSRLSVVGAQALAITLRHSPHVKALNVSCCGLKADHCKALGSGLGYLQELRMPGNAGLHDDKGLDMLASVITVCGAPKLTVLVAHTCRLDMGDCNAVQLLLYTLPSLRELYIGVNVFGTAGLFELQESLFKAELTVLAFNDNELDSGAGRVLADIVKVNQHLEYMYVMHNVLGKRGVHDLLRGIGCSCSLQVVDFSDTDVGEGVVDAVSTCLSQRADQVETTGSLSPPPLTFLFHKNKMSKAALAELARNAPYGSRDRVECGSIVVEGGAVMDRGYGKFFENYARRGSEGDLDMCRQGVDDRGAEEIASLLKENSDVHVLDLGRNAIGDCGVSALCDSLRVNTTLLGLSLALNGISPAGFVSMATALATSNTTLQFISLCGNPVFQASTNVDSKVQQEALNKLLGMPSLRCLGLAGTRLEDAGCEVIGDTLASGGCFLTFLLLSGTGISDKGAEVLSAGLEQNTSMKYIDLCKNKITNAGAERICRCLEYREKQGSSLRQVWMEGNPADPEVYAGCMVNSTFGAFSVTDFMSTYL